MFYHSVSNSILRIKKRKNEQCHLFIYYCLINTRISKKYLMDLLRKQLKLEIQLHSKYRVFTIVFGKYV